MKAPIITPTGYHELMNGSVVTHGSAKLAVYGHEFVMRAGSSVVKLIIDDTDVDTLNGEWLEFTMQSDAQDAGPDEGPFDGTPRNENGWTA